MNPSDLTDAAKLAMAAYNATINNLLAENGLLQCALGEARAGQVRPTVMWQPIATAPHDGTVIQLWAGYYQHTGTFISSMDCWCALADDVELVPQPTQWRPLPDPPENVR